MTNSAGLVVTLAPATGLWSGAYAEPASGQRLPFKTTLQWRSGGFGGGYLIQSNLSGAVRFELAP